MRRAFAPTLKRLSVVLGVAFTVVLVIVSPIVLVLVDKVPGVNWPRLAEIGQTYGAASALFAALALFGVAGSLVVQGRQVRLAQVQAARSLQVELMKMAMDDSDLTPLWAYSAQGDQSRARRSMFLQLTFKYFEMLYTTGLVDSQSLRNTMRYRFMNAEVRTYWQRVHEIYRQEAVNAAERRFVNLVQDEWRQAASGSAPVMLPTMPPVTNVAGEGARTRPWRLTRGLASFALLSGWAFLRLYRKQHAEGRSERRR